ncbi:MAG: hypothetical protein JOZ42_09070 [Acetobacteraceae bacterium]|nr:hypothetical protein [Acetobacteraceae bacterium]
MARPGQGRALAGGVMTERPEGVAPVPVAFGGCAGWYHAPSAAAATRRGVVMCGPLGYDLICTYRNWRRLAKGLAEAGLPTLRFDYFGTGDSAGEDGPDRLPSWLASIRNGLEWMAQNGGVDEVTLCGLRLGSVLAMLAAADSAVPIARAALLAPPISGRTFVRELKLKQRLTGGSSEPGWVEDAGFRFHDTDLERLQPIDMAEAITAASVPELLILHVPWLSAGADADSETLRRAGISVHAQPFRGFVEFMRDADLATPPAEDFAAVAGWLRDGASIRPRSKSGGVSEAARLTLPGGIEEHPVAFGDDGGLFGVLCRPSLDLGRADVPPPVLFLNTGANHHIGNARISVLMARALAERGVPSLRIDVSGLGDSARAAPAPEGGGVDAYRLAQLRLYRPEYLGDIRAAISLLEERGYRGCTLMGVCSGANFALHAASLDERVTGLMLVNLPSFEERWRASQRPREALQPLFSAARKWRRVVVPSVVRQRATEALERSRIAARRSLRRATDLVRLLTTIEVSNNSADRLMRKVRRRVPRILLVYSAGDPGLAVLESHFGRKGRQLLRHGGVALTIVPAVNHTFDSSEGRERLIDLAMQTIAAPRSQPERALADAAISREDAAPLRAMKNRLAHRGARLWGSVARAGTHLRRAAAIGGPGSSMTGQRRAP